MPKLNYSPIRTFACAMLVMLLLALPAAAQREEPLPPEQAFRFSAAMEENTAVVVYQMPEGVYLYQDRIVLTTATPGMRVESVNMPAGTEHEDEFFGKTTVYYGQLTLRAAVSGDGEFTLLARAQGCDEQVGICYPPFEQTALLSAASHSAEYDGSDFSSAAEPPSYETDEAGYLANAIAEKNLAWIIIVFFALGLGLSFTPCVLPMIPILLGIISQGNPTRRRIMIRTGIYISGVALAFTVFGVLAALSGQMLAATIQQPWMLITIAVLFILLAASSLGIYELRLPPAIMQWATRGGSGGVFLMGAVSVIVVSPCVAAPLIGALLYIGQSKDVIIGATALLSLALGMSVLLAAAGIVGGKVLPRAGGWTEKIKQLFGVLLLFVAVWVTTPLLPPVLQLVFYGVLLLLLGALLLPGATAAPTLGQRALLAGAIAAIIWGSVMLVGAAGGSRDVLTPLSPLINRSAGDREHAALKFRPVTRLDELEQIAANTTQPVMLDFYADWCISCKEFERFTLQDERVKERLQNVLLLRADVTANNQNDQALLERFNLFGPPAILFFDAGGRLVKNVRVTGYQDADQFLKTLAAAGL